MLKKYLGLIIIIAAAVLFVLALGVFNANDYQSPIKTGPGGNREAILMDSINDLGQNEWDRARYENLKYKVNTSFSDEPDKAYDYEALLVSNYVKSMNTSFNIWLGKKKGLSYASIDSLLLAMENFKDKDDEIDKHLKTIKNIKKFVGFESALNNTIAKNMYTQNLVTGLNDKIERYYSDLKTYYFVDLQIMKKTYRDSTIKWKDNHKAFKQYTEDRSFRYNAGAPINCGQFRVYKPYYDSIKKFAAEYDLNCY